MALGRLVAEIKDAGERHRQRHRASGFNFALSDSIEFLNPAHWNAAPRQHSTLIRHRNPLINAMIPNLLQGLIPNQQPPERHPFKMIIE